MGKVFITGDRHGGGVCVALVAIEMLRAVSEGNKVFTGENGGVEQMVRGLGEQAGVEVDIVSNSGLVLENGKPDWADRAKTLVEREMSVVAIHTDPHSSSIITQMLDIVPDDELRIVTHADLLV